MSKVTELIKGNKNISYSLEVMPGVTEEEIDELDIDPLFFSVTWFSKSHQCKDMDIDSLRTARMLRKKQKHVLVHISCDMMKESYMKEVLGVLQENNICNLYLILGEKYDPDVSEFRTTSLLIKFIRKQTGNYFCIGVAGFDCTEEKIVHLKEKVDSGADFVITQAFFDINTFKNLIRRCEMANVNVPIIPGLFPFESYKQLSSFINLCKIKVSDDLLKAIKNKEESHAQCLEIVKQLLSELNNDCHVTHFHFFTLNNLQRVNKLIQRENLLSELKF